MYNLKSPPEKIQALFFQALRVVDPKLKPSDIAVTVQPSKLAHTPHFEGDRDIKIDLSKTALAEHVDGMTFGLIDFGGVWLADPKNGTIEYRGNGAMEKATVSDLQLAMARSMTLDIKIAEPLGKAAKGAGASRSAGNC